MEQHAKVGSVDEQQTYCNTEVVNSIEGIDRTVRKHRGTDSERGAVLHCCSWLQDEGEVEGEAGHRYPRPVATTIGKKCVAFIMGHIKRFCPLNFNGPAGKMNASRLEAIDRFLCTTGRTIAFRMQHI